MLRVCVSVRRQKGKLLVALIYQLRSRETGIATGDLNGVESTGQGRKWDAGVCRLECSLMDERAVEAIDADAQRDGRMLGGLQE